MATWVERYWRGQEHVRKFLIRFRTFSHGLGWITNLSFWFIFIRWIQRVVDEWKSPTSSSSSSSQIVALFRVSCVLWLLTVIEALTSSTMKLLNKRCSMNDFLVYKDQITSSDAQLLFKVKCEAYHYETQWTYAADDNDNDHQHTETQKVVTHESHHDIELKHVDDVSDADSSSSALLHQQLRGKITRAYMILENVYLANRATEQWLEKHVRAVREQHADLDEFVSVRHRFCLEDQRPFHLVVDNTSTEEDSWTNKWLLWLVDKRKFYLSVCCGCSLVFRLLFDYYTDSFVCPVSKRVNIESSMTEIEQARQEAHQVVYQAVPNFIPNDLVHIITSYLPDSQFLLLSKDNVLYSKMNAHLKRV